MELFRSLGALAEPPTIHSQRLARLLELDATPTRAAYTDVFTLHLYPYASVYVGAEGMLGGEARDRVAGFWRALGENPPAEPDHLALLLASYARLCELAPAPSAATPQARTRAAFLWEHVLSWAPIFARKVQEIAPPPYAAWGELLEAALSREAREVAPPTVLPLHLREAPEFASAQASLEELLGALLTPVRCGFILTRADLQRAASELGVGLRAGERRYVLRALIEQEPAVTFDWLRREAIRSADRYEDLLDPLGDSGRFWQARARHAAAILAAVVRDARAVRAHS